MEWFTLAMAAPRNLSSLKFLKACSICKFVKHRSVLNFQRDFPLRHTLGRGIAAETASSQRLLDEFRDAQKQRVRKREGSLRPLWKTEQIDPAKHSENHVGLFYNISKEDFQRWLRTGFMPHYYSMCKAYKENHLMIRSPSIEIISCMKQANYQQPVIRYLLYGREGSGKTSSLAHVIHYCGRQDWLILHVPWAMFWNRYFREKQPSSYKEGRYDLPLEAVEWLANFKATNESLLQKLDIRTQRRYAWSKREAAEENSSILESIEFGLTRAKYASDVMGMVLKEVKRQSNEERFKTLVAVDGVNAFWTPTIIKLEDKTFVKPEDVSLIRNFKKIVKNDWIGGAVICTVDQNAHANYKTCSYLPAFLLGKEGLEWFDPHIPFHVGDYSDKEIHSCLEFYSDKQWIQNPVGHTEEGRKEIIFLSSRNPLELWKVTRTW